MWQTPTPFYQNSQIPGSNQCAAALRPNGNFPFPTLCRTGLIPTVPFSTNFAAWQPLPTLTNATAVTTFTHTNATGRSAGFYRVSVP